MTVTAIIFAAIAALEFVMLFLLCAKRLDPVVGVWYWTDLDDEDGGVETSMVLSDDIENILKHQDYIRIEVVYKNERKDV